ncbi:MAG: nucleoside-diphosphate kinase, partial [Chloroflexi bacterium]|nr:nucleoside-diphosphate kinase [Chloroflexota bacterium]
MSTERTLVLVKPDGVQRGLTGEIVGRLERTGLQIIGMKLMMISEDLASRHYAEHTEKPFYRGLVRFITSSPVVALALEGPSAIATIRQVMGVTDPA